MNHIVRTSSEAFSKIKICLANVRTRLTAWYVFLLAAMLIGFSVLVYVSMERSLYSDLDAALQTRTEQIEATIDVGPDGLTIANGSADHPRISGRTHLSSTSTNIPFIILDMAGHIRATSGDSSKVLPAGPDVIGPALHGDSVIGTLRASEKEAIRFLCVPLEMRGEQVGVVVVGRSLFTLESTLTRLRLILGSLILGALVLAGITGYLMAWRALAPIDAITRTARKITAKDLSLRLDLQNVDDEVGRLARTFNEMLGRLDDQFQKERQFTADVSHELRTPLTVIRSAADIALRDPNPTMEKCRAALLNVRDEASRLSHIIDDLLFFARADFRQMKLNVAPVDLSTLLGDVFDYGVRLASLKEIDIECAPATARLQTYIVNGDRVQLMRMFRNIVDNAVKYTPHGGRIKIEMKVEDDSIHVMISDTGPGIPEEELPRIFDRFYRVDSSRSRAASINGMDMTSGIGLGLAIAKTIAELHGGSIAARSRLGEGSTFEVILPRAIVLQEGE